MKTERGTRPSAPAARRPSRRGRGVREAGVAEQLLNGDDLKRWLRATQTARVLRFLRQNRIPYWIAGGQPVTTLAAINARLIKEEPPEEFDFSGPATRRVRR